MAFGTDKIIFEPSGYQNPSNKISSQHSKWLQKIHCLYYSRKSPFVSLLAHKEQPLEQVFI